jgi:hypothetical protein
MTSLPQNRSVQGRRPSVGPTRARRRPPVRRRPGAGFLPAWRPAARVRAPRARFRVYAEDEYFAQAGQITEVARAGSGWPAEGSVFSASDAGTEGAHGPRVAAGAMLVAGAGALGVVLVLGTFATSTHVRRKTALRAARASARTAGAALAITATRTAHLRPKATSRGARRARPATAVATHALPVRRSASARSRSNGRSSTTADSRSAAGHALPSATGTAGAPAFLTARGDAEGFHGPSAEMAASSDTRSRRRSGEFGFER